MRCAGDVDPLVAGNLVVADDAADAFGENFGAAARHGIHALRRAIFSSVSRTLIFARLTGIRSRPW